MLGPFRAALPCSFALLVAVSAFVSTITGCAWTQAPDPEEALTEPVRIDDSDRGEQMLFSTADGDWAYLDGAAAETFHPGGLAVLESENGPKHLYAVVSTHDWGLRLQRLDGERLERDRFRGDFRRVGGLETTGRIGDLACVGRGNPAENGCLGDVSRGTYWALFALGPDHELRTASEPFSPSGPYRRRALLFKKGVGPGLETLPTSFEIEGRWVAVRSARDSPPAEAVALVDSKCELPVDRLHKLRIEVLERTVELPDHPVGIESLAFEHGVDVAVECRNGRPRAVMPTLFRPYPVLRGEVPLGPPLLGSQPHAIRSSSVESQTAIVAALAHLAVGDTMAADFLLESALRELPVERNRKLVVASMQVAAAADRPEAALRWGRIATEEAWNRDNRPRYILGAAAVRAAAGSMSTYYGGLRDARRAARRRSEEGLAQWSAWSSVAAEHLGSAGAETLRETAKEHLEAGRTRWAAAFSWLRARDNPEFSPDLLGGSKAESSEWIPLYRGLRGEEIALDCSDAAACPLDVYGRRLRAFVETRQQTDRIVDGISAVGEAAYRPGFWTTDAYDALAEGPNRLVLGALMSAVAGSVGLPEIDRWLADGLEQAVDTESFCRLDFAPAAAERIGRARRDAEVAPFRIQLFSWLADGGISAICASPSRAAKTLGNLENAPDALPELASPLFAAMLDHTERRGARVKIVEHGATFAYEQDRRRECKRRRLALAAAAARAGRPRAADAFLNDAVNCDASSVYGDSQNLLIAYVTFLQSGTLPRRIENRERDRIRTVLRQTVPQETCAGLVDSRYPLFDHLHPEIAHLARKLRFRNRSESDDLQLRTSLDKLEEGREALASARRALRNAEFGAARPLLTKAAERFEEIDNLPGQNSVEHLARSVYGADPATLAETDLERASCEGDEESTPSDSDSGLALPGSPAELRCRLAESSALPSTEQLPSALLGELDSPKLRSLAALAIIHERDGLLRRLVEAHREPFEAGLCRSVLPATE